MKKVDGSIVTEIDGTTSEEFLFTYSEQEKQDNGINRSNAKAVFLPEFVPFYPAMKAKYNLTDTETLVFGFIKFFTSNASDKFYFTNEQLAGLFSCSIKTVSRAITGLEKKTAISISRRVKAGGGQIRFIKPTGQFDQSSGTKTTSLAGQKLPTNKNKINNNKIKRESTRTQKTKFNSLGKLTPSVLEEISQTYEVPLEFVQDIKEDLELYVGGKGKRYKDYRLALITWVKRERKRKVEGFARKRGGTYDARTEVN